jgi:U3 small nucleolar RNA-associated protein 13
VYERVEGMQLIHRTAASPNDGKQSAYLVSAGSKGILRLWKSGEDDNRLLEQAKQSEKDVFGEARGGYLAMIRHDHDRAVVLVADAEHNVLLVKIAEMPDGSSIDAKPMLRVQTVETIVGHNDEILDVKVVPNSNDVAVVTNSHLVRLFDRDTFRCRVLDQHHTATVLCVDASPCGRYLATCGKDQTMRIWQTATGRCVGNAVGHTEAVGSTALSRQSGRYQVSGKAAQNGGGSFVVTVSVDRTMKRWNLPGDAALDEAAATENVLAFKAFASARAHDKDINIVSIAPNDSLIATGSQDKTIALWKAVDLSQVVVLKGHRRGVWDCQFSPYDRVLASSSGDKTIKLWSLSDYSCVRTFHDHSASVLRVRYLLGGLQLVSAGADGLVKLWTVRTNECEATMDSHTGKIWGMDVVCGGEDNGPQQQQQRLLFTGAADSRLVAWKDTTAAVHAEKLKEREEEILLNQQLMNHIRRKEYKAALRVSLERDKPHTSLKILNEIFNAESAAASREPPLTSIKSFIKEQPLPLVVRLLRYCREWNVRARHSHVALTVVQIIVSTISVAILAAQDDVPEIIAGMIPYIERHFERLDRLHTSAYLIDFCATSMGIMDADDNAEPSATTTDTAVDKDDSAAGLFAKWEASAEFKPLVKTVVDGRVDLGGNVAVRVSLQSGAEDSDEVITVGESDSEDESSASS